MQITLTFTAEQHCQLSSHLFPGDGLEAAALVLCGRAVSETGHRLLAHKIVLIPHDACERSEDRVTWPTSFLIPMLEQAVKRGMAILKIHSHPGGLTTFSAVDDRSDEELFPTVHAVIDDGQPHASAVMLPNGSIFGRCHLDNGDCVPINCINLIGDDLIFWHSSDTQSQVPEFARRHAQVFGKGTFRILRQLSIAVIGCSGTGSIVIEQLARLGVGRLVLVDPDLVEEKNLNRIVNSVVANIGQSKTEVLSAFIDRLGLGTVAQSFPVALSDLSALRAVACCDIVIGCMDSIDGRDLLNRIATFYLQPYFDVGIRLDADGEGGIEQICGSVHYVRPGGSSLKSRGVYTAEQARAAGLRRTDPASYKDEVKRGYIRGIEEERPAVISVNMIYAGLLVTELLARLHPYRLDANREFAAQTISLSIGVWQRSEHCDADTALARYLGRGNMNPPLDQPYLDVKGGL
ncbi:MAG TPA: ThiF family adenylyltransferase [Xanthobacteraceae bacterium]|jgi:proteasome lid subunit RPN8/RPN11|nr:ThiF family adenylyltransferase [Xanthobacteraceae bacterium]